MVDADSLCYSSLKEEDGEEVVAFMAEHFYPREPLWSMEGLPTEHSPQSTGLHMTYEDNKEWIHGSVQEWARSGVSVVARDPATGRLGGTLLGTILTRQQANTYQQALNSPKTKVCEDSAHVLSVLEAAVDFFARYQCVDRILELAMITVSEQMGGRGVGRQLVQFSPRAALVTGLRRVPWFPQESEQRGRHLGCQLATAQATAVPSQRLLYRLGYESLYTMDYTTFEIAGDRVFDVDKMLGTPSAKVMARLITPDQDVSDPALE
ncbi:hypothetical protein GWK47_041663 [Chionoecetes opilio]|uniref:N-acetyltransferase domain-containing protein n=1 Tax=Chionoecetes opilio TaxID=41210 RepID=A0A8J4YB10_CHIOP|nr:hypothetical protein GWK47_041663 [Chionoecetes opilio]